MVDIAIIGAGLSGLIAANKLNHISSVEVFEKSRGVSGRMATRNSDPFFFDHGAQYFKIKTDSLMKLMKFDKKNTSEKINFSLPNSIGEVSINHEIELKKVESYLLEFFQND